MENKSIFNIWYNWQYKEGSLLLPIFKNSRHFVLLKEDFSFHLKSLFVEALSLWTADLPSQQSPANWFMGQSLVYANWESSTGLREAIIDYAGWQFGPPYSINGCQKESAGFIIFLGLGNS